MHFYQFARAALVGIAVSLSLINASVAVAGRAQEIARTLNARVPSFLPPGYYVTFADEFFVMPDIGTWSNTSANQTHTWFAHTPWNGDYGASSFDDPGSPDDPFSILSGNILRIRSQADSSGNWHSGLISAGDPYGNGFAQQYGYFEIRMKLPKSPGTWPAFWLGSQNSVDGATAEIDFEMYGQDPTHLHITAHNWPSDASQQYWNYGDNLIKVSDMSADYHNYGVLIDPAHITWYFDGKAILQKDTYPAATARLFPIVSLAMGGCDGNCPITSATVTPSDLLVQYVRVYSNQKALAQRVP